jgi:hypothetical protein
MRIEKSWNPPHRVVLKGHDKFYGRNAAGKFPMDVQQLRRSFTDSASIAERVRNFRADRLMSIVRNDTPIEMDTGSKLVLHILPIEAFSSAESHDLGAKHSNPNHYRPMHASGWDERITLEGRLVFSEFGGSTKSYLHVYRTGIVEAVEGTILNHVHQDGKKNLPSLAYERLILERLPGYISILQTTGIQPPFLIGLSLTDIKGAYIGIDNAWMHDHDLRPVVQQHLVLPEVILQSYTDDILKVIRPSFDLVWNACGLPRSRNFDANDNWAPSR